MYTDHHLPVRASRLPAGHGSRITFHEGNHRGLQDTCLHTESSSLPCELEGLPAVVVEHSMDEKELEEKFGQEGWKQLPDEIYRRYRFTPAKIEPPIR